MQSGEIMSAKPKWLDVYEHMKHRISSGAWARGTLIPSQEKLCGEFGVPRHSVRRAIKRLQNEDLLTSWQGHGVQVSDAPLTYTLSERTRFASNLRKNGHSVDVQLIAKSARKRPTRRIAHMLNVSDHQVVSFGEFMHSVDGMPTLIGRHYFNSIRFPNILDLLEEVPNVPDTFRTLGVGDYFRTSTAIEVRSPTPSEALALKIPRSQPVIELCGRNVDAAGDPIEVTEAIARADRIRLEVNT